MQSDFHHGLLIHRCGDSIILREVNGQFRRRPSMSWLTPRLTA